MTTLFCDTETYSEVPIAHGTYVYAENAEVMLFTYAFDDGEVQYWDRTANPTMLFDLQEGLNDPDIMTVWHNGGLFDRNVLKNSLKIDIPTERIHDVMVQALAHSLPGALDKLCTIFKLDDDEAKDQIGKKHIHLFCKPRPKNMKLRRATSETHPKEWQEFIDYAKRDVTAMRTIYHKLPLWNYSGSELRLWRLDQRINDRGFRVDRELAEGAIRATDFTKQELAQRTQVLTSGDVQAATQRDALLAHILKAHGVTLPNMQKATLERRINDESLPDIVRELLAIRLNACTTSTSKYKRVLNGVTRDGRLKGTLQFDGASRTGRWSGRTFQPQNLPRPTHGQREIDTAIRALKLDCLELITDDIMKLTSSAIRGCIIASENKKLVVSDLSNIEGRFAAWVADEKWKIKAFNDFDECTGEDLYRIAYAKAFGVEPSDVGKDKRQIGKVMELALAYQGGVGAFVTFAAVYRMDMNELVEKAAGTIPSDVFQEAESMWEWAIDQKRTLGLEKDVFVVCDSLKRMWRRAHPEIVSFWKEIQEAVQMAIGTPGETIKCRKLKMLRKGEWLRIILPSGRSLCYPSPRIEENGGISYMGNNQYTRKWERLHSYGGKFFENVCQAGARDVMADNMHSVEDSGYDIILTCHDELITESPDNDSFNSIELSKLLATNPQWATGLPLAAGGFEAYRYRKD